MTTLPIDSGTENFINDDGRHPESGFENPASVAAELAKRTAAAGGDMVQRIGGNRRNAAKALVTFATIGGAVNAGSYFGAEPAMKAMGPDNALVKFAAGTLDQPTIKFTDRVAPVSAAQSHTEMLAETGAAEVGDKNGQVPTRHRPVKDNQAPNR